MNESDKTLKDVAMFFDHGDWLEQREKVRKTKGVDPLRYAKLKSTIKTETIEFHYIYIEWNAGSYIVNLKLKPNMWFRRGLDTYDSFNNNFQMELVSADFERFSTKEKPDITVVRSSESLNSLTTNESTK